MIFNILTVSDTTTNYALFWIDSGLSTWITFGHFVLFAISIGRIEATKSLITITAKLVLVYPPLFQLALPKSHNSDQQGSFQVEAKHNLIIQAFIAWNSAVGEGKPIEN